MHVADDVLAVDVQHAAGRHAQRHVEDGAVLGRVDVLAREHRVTVRGDVGGVGQVHEEAHGLVGHPLLRVVEDEVGRLRRHAPRPLRVVGEEVAQMPLGDLVVVRRQRLPLGCRREVHARQSTARRVAGVSCGEESDDGRDGRGVLQEEAVAAVEHLEPGAGDGAGQELAVGRRGDPVEAAAAHQGRAGDGAQAVGRVVLGPGRQLVGEARLASPPASSSRMRSPDQPHHVGVGLLPGLVPPGVDQLPCARPTAPRGPGRPARAAGRRRRPPRRPRCRPGRAGAPARGAGWRPPGPPCRRTRSRGRGSRPTHGVEQGRRRRRRSRPWRRATAARCSGPGPAGRRPAPRSSRPAGRRSGGVAGAGHRRCPK